MADAKLDQELAQMLGGECGKCGEETEGDAEFCEACVAEVAELPDPDEPGISPTERIERMKAKNGWRPHRFKKRELKEGRKPWMRQPRETVQAYEAFMTYLMLSQEERTIQRAADIVGKSRHLLSKWSQMWSWRFRVAAYEEHYMLLRLESIQADRDMVFKEQKLVADLGMQIVSDHFEKFIQAMERNEDGEILIKPDALVRLFDTAAKVQARAVTQRIENAEEVAAQQEKLAERYSEELAGLLGAVLNDIGLTPDQEEKAKAAVAMHLAGKAADGS